MAPTAVVAPASRVVTQQSTASLQRELKKEVTPETVARETQPEAPQQEEPQKQEAPLLGEKAKQQATLPRNLDGSQAELFEQKRSTIELQRPLRQTRSRAENPQTEISSPELHR